MAFSLNVSVLLVLISSLTGASSRAVYNPSTDGLLGINNVTSHLLLSVDRAVEVRDGGNGVGDTGLVCGRTCYACKSSCGTTKRSFYDVEPEQSHVWLDKIQHDHAEDNLTHTPRRQFQVPPTGPINLGKFVANLAEESGYIDLCPKTRRGGDTSYAAMRYFRNYPSRRLVISTAGTDLCGCTVMTIVSSQAVYMAHFWENLGFRNTVAEDPEPADFTRNIENLIRGVQPQFYTSGDALDVTAFSGNGESCWSALMVPRGNTAARVRRFPAETQRLQNLILTLLPGCQVVIYDYWVRSDTKVAGGSGVAAFEYDPNADGEGHGDWRLWYEKNFEQGRQLGINVIPSF